jgi:hypothetical protein
MHQPNFLKFKYVPKIQSCSIRQAISPMIYSQALALLVWFLVASSIRVHLPKFRGTAANRMRGISDLGQRRNDVSRCEFFPI